MAATAGAAAAAIANAIKASGAIVRVEPEVFDNLVARIDTPLVVMSNKSMFSGGYRYLTSYKGLIFYAKSQVHLNLPGGVEVVLAKSIWVPS
jgi:hypothetical protein